MSPPCRHHPLMLNPVLVQHLWSTAADRAQHPSVPDCPAGFAPEGASLIAASICLPCRLWPYAILPMLLWLLYPHHY